MELTILMPCLNEASTLQSCIESANKFISENKLVAEIIIADNGSTDGSQNLALSTGAKVVDVKKRGYGAAIYYGTMESSGKYIIVGDSDASYDFYRLMPFLKKLREGADLVIGNRFKGGIEPGAMPWKNRYIGNPILSAIGWMFFGVPVKDFHCGLRGYSVESFKKLNIKTSGMEFASEMIIKAALLNFKIEEVPTTLKPDGRNRPPHLRPWRDGWRHLRFMLIFSPKWLFLYPGIILFLLGLLTSAILTLNPVRISGTSFDVHTLLYTSVFSLIGFQLILFSIFTRIYTYAEGITPLDKNIRYFEKESLLETGVIIGTCLILLAFIGSLIALMQWKSFGFGELNPSSTLRLVIPSVLALALGIQIIFASFFIGVLQIKLRDTMDNFSNSFNPATQQLNSTTKF